MCRYQPPSPELLALFESQQPRPTRRIICSEAAMELMYGPSARQALAAGAVMGAEQFAPGWWRWDVPALPGAISDSTPPEIHNPTVRVRVESGPTLWETS